MNAPDRLPKYVTPRAQIARGVITEDLLGYEPKDGQLEPVFVRGFEADATARGWPVYSRAQRGIALRHGTIVAWAHGWRIDGVHDLIFEGPTEYHPTPRPLVIQPADRFTRILGQQTVSLELKTHEPP